MIRRGDVWGHPRFGGEVLRYHTWPTLQKQTIAHHSWNVGRIWLEIFQASDSDSGKVLRYVMFHDCGELRSGDAPFPVKRDNPALKTEMDRIEEEGLLKMGILLPTLTIWEKKSVKTADLLEMAEFCQIETRLGNQYAEPLVGELLEEIRKILSENVLSVADKQRVKSYVRDRMGVQL